MGWWEKKQRVVGYVGIRIYHSRNKIDWVESSEKIGKCKERGECAVSKYGRQCNKEGKYVVYGGSVGEERQIDSFFNVERICECQNIEWE